MTQGNKPGPEIKCDRKNWLVTHPVENGMFLDPRWEPGLTYVIRIREAGTQDWSFGFEIPIASCTFVDLKPDTEYELQFRAKNAAGEGAPSYLTMRTNSAGGSSNTSRFRSVDPTTARAPRPGFPHRGRTGPRVEHAPGNP